MVEPIGIVRELLTTATARPASSTLDGDITATATSITIADGTGFTSNGNFVVLCESELMIATRSGTTVTVESGGRGALGTTAATHDDATAIYEATFYDVVGARVYIGIHEEDNDTPALVLQTRSEGRATEGLVYDLAFTTRSFGGSDSMVDAKMVHRMAHDRLMAAQNESTNSGRFILGYPTGGGQELIDPDVEWPYVVGFWRAHTQ